MDSQKLSGFTLRLPQEKARAFRVRCAMEGSKAQTVLSRLVDDFLQNKEEPNAETIAAMLEAEEDRGTITTIEEIRARCNALR
jgi:hypothetical protein